MSKPRTTVVGLADSMVMERTTMVRALNPLRRAGWVMEAADPRGRAVEFVLSNEGIRKFEQACPFWEAAQQEFETKFGLQNAQALRATLLSIPI